MEARKAGASSSDCTTNPVGGMENQGGSCECSPFVGVPRTMFGTRVSRQGKEWLRANRARFLRGRSWISIRFLFRLSTFVCDEV